MIRAARKATKAHGGAPRKLPLCPLGERIDSLAAKRNMTIGEVAAAAGITRQSLGMIRNGTTSRPSAETAFAIARALGVSVDGLYDGVHAAPTRSPGRPAVLTASPFGVRLQRRMDAAQITRRELAKRANLDHVTIWRWMRGRHRVPADAILAMARVLRCQPSDLLIG